MPFSSTEVLRCVDAVAIILARAYQLARVRLASVGSPVTRLLCQRDHALGNAQLLKRELAILRGQRRLLQPHRRPDYCAEQRLGILQVMRLRGWSIGTTARRFVLHPNTVRSWIKAVEGRGNERLLADAMVWNRLDDLVRWTVHELRRFCPESELGTRAIARQLVRAGLAVSRSTAQRILREEKPMRPKRARRARMREAVGALPHHLLTPASVNRVWHLDLTTLRVLWFRFTLAAVLDGCSRKLLGLKVYDRVPRQREMARLVGEVARESGRPRFVITDHGTQFRKKFGAALRGRGIGHVKGRVRAPYLNGKVERFFRTFRVWWGLVLCGLSRGAMQRRMDGYREWYNCHRPHSAMGGRTPEEVWGGVEIPKPVAIRCRDPDKPVILVRRVNHCGDPGLPVIKILISARGLIVG